MEAEVCIFPSCPTCRNILLFPRETKVTCNNNCNKWLLAKKLSARLASTITFTINHDNVTLTLFPHVLNEYFNKNFRIILKNFFEKAVELEDTLIEFDDIVDLTYSSPWKVVTKITHHENKEDII